MALHTSRVFIIAEAGVNHNGSLEAAKRLADAAWDAGVDAVKFQTFQSEKIIVRAAPMAEYQSKNIGTGKSQLEMLKELELSYADFRSLKNYCDGRGIAFLSTPDEEESLDFLIGLGMDKIKVGSGEVENIPFLRRVGACGLPVILSTGMSNLGEVDRALATLRQAGAGPITLLHCTTNYPCPMGEVNLRAMLTLGHAFQTPIGYSDHTDGIEVSVAAVALGACIIEKHFTLDKNLPGPDHKASLDPGELRALVKAIRNVEQCLGDGLKQAAASEKSIAPAVKRSIVAKTPIAKGAIFTDQNLTVKRAGGLGISSRHWDLVVGRAASQDYSPDDLVSL